MSRPRRKTRRATPHGRPAPAEPAASSPARESFGRAALAIFTLALLIRALHLWQIRAVLAIDPEIAMTHYNLANVLAEQGHVEESAAHNNLRILIYSQGRLDEAIVHVRRVLQINPDFAEAKANLDVAVQPGGR